MGGKTERKEEKKNGRKKMELFARLTERGRKRKRKKEGKKAKKGRRGNGRTLVSGRRKEE